MKAPMFLFEAFYTPPWMHAQGQTPWKLKRLFLFVTKTVIMKLISFDLVGRSKEHHEGEDICSLNLQSTPKSGEKKTHFVVDESMLNDFCINEE